MRRLIASVGLIGLAVGVAVGGPTTSASAPAPASTPSVSQLIAQLGSDEFRDREAAVAALEKAGPDAIPALREAMKSELPEVRQRAAPILLKLQRTADSTTRLAPKKVALNYKDLPLGNAINDFRARTGLNIALDTSRVADPLRKVTCTTGELPVWEALEALCVAAGLKEVFKPELDVPKATPSESSRRRGYVPPPQIPTPDAVPVVLIDGKSATMPGDRRTAVRVLALPPSFPGHRVTLGTGETTLCFDIAPAPGLNWQDVASVKITKLLDDAGRYGGAGSIKQPDFNPYDFDGVIAWGGPGVRFGGGFGGGFGGRFDPRTGMPIYPDTMPNLRIVPVPLKLATPSARSIKRLEGSVIGEILLTGQTLITIPDAAKNTGTAFDGPGQVRLTVVGYTEPKDGAGASMQLLLEYPSPWSVGARRGFNPGGIWPESPRHGNQMPTVQVYDAAGKQMSPGTGNSFSDGSDDGQTMFQRITWTFRKEAGTPAKLVVVGPKPVVVEVPFVLENVPLP